MSDEFKLLVHLDSSMPAFMAYLAESVHTGTIEMKINLPAMVLAAKDAGNSITLEEVFVSSFGHEVLHAVQDLFRAELDEDQVEQIVEKAMESLYG